ncbi:hypothetical protein DPR00_28555 [Burkholderia pseudomallei]|uniref:Uncharacterized protein n=1 Tax=Burkholderia pseudomallei 1710a TaxID=320371 RepID=A0A0E1WBM9_BURPE|nr:hypothetical protein EGY14_22760 [Burkholderia pseudomallei]EET09814.1 hypothetical protein BURPS1710A_2610 [Burkholderia pseudomallei 1710a]PNW99748.1 hypothetical protein CF640_00160 [Burkholderia pseudomallei]PNX01548.1 hypothetical protein CF641_26675 [Burkholderia pseudomallei]PNX35416.1 hypothetical protein CF642_27560 [Burkholderia pseudomallei]
MTGGDPAPGRRPDTERLSFFRAARLGDLDQAKAANAPRAPRRDARRDACRASDAAPRASRRMPPPFVCPGPPGAAFPAARQAAREPPERTRTCVSPTAGRVRPRDLFDAVQPRPQRCRPPRADARLFLRSIISRESAGHDTSRGNLSVKSQGNHENKNFDRLTRVCSFAVMSGPP